MPANLSQGNCQYTLLNTAGTTTINNANLGTITPAGVFYGMLQLAPGTTFAATIYDIYATGLTTNTATLLTGTGTAGQVFTPGPAGVGVRYRGALVAVASGTPGAINALWD
jgi:hypothetical protein